ncbi:hypothetical protein BVY03_05930 [bacterium K02(2017)]|nr:hypothetical protein BVY03_05930 [bacterium K02(2017)]
MLVVIQNFYLKYFTISFICLGIFAYSIPVQACVGCISTNFFNSKNCQHKKVSKVPPCHSVITTTKVQNSSPTKCCCIKSKTNQHALNNLEIAKTQTEKYLRQCLLVNESLLSRVYHFTNSSYAQGAPPAYPTTYFLSIKQSYLL